MLLVEAALAKALNKVEATWDPRPTVGVVLAAGGCGRLCQGRRDRGLDEAAKLDGKVFHAGTALNAEGQVVTAGGRVLCATAIDRSVSRLAAGLPPGGKIAGMAVSTARTSATAPSPASAARLAQPVIRNACGARFYRRRTLRAGCGMAIIRRHTHERTSLVGRLRIAIAVIFGLLLINLIRCRPRLPLPLRRPRHAFR